MLHTIIVPGIGGSEYEHWQSWLQRQLPACSRVEQNDWKNPIIDDWVSNLLATIDQVNSAVQIVAHSFGCLTSLRALHEHQALRLKVKHLTLVAPANPKRFSLTGYAHEVSENMWQYFQNLNIHLQAQLLISENDPWLDYQDALQLSKAWKIKTTCLGQVGHINVASGFGPFPEIYEYILPAFGYKKPNVKDYSSLTAQYSI